MLWLFGLSGCTREDARGQKKAGVTIGEIVLEKKVEPPTSPVSVPERSALYGDLRERLYRVRWVAFAPTGWDPTQNLYPTAESVREDLSALREVGFSGIVTYAADELMPQLAREVGFEAMIYGIWNPEDSVEARKAQAAGSDEIVVGYVVGNEGLHERYSYESLKGCLQHLAGATGKPVTTSEQIEDYADPRLLELGDWLFPNVHPYCHSITDPELAVEWTKRQYEKLAGHTAKPILFKEVGLPSGGDPRVSETSQAEYYRRLGRTNVKFVWFEAFDQPWKTWTPVEPHWGLLRADRTPKTVVRLLAEGQ